MLVNMLYIEGKLDEQVLMPVFEGSPTLKQGGSKNALKPRTLAVRQENEKVAAGYLRDRDFDFDPPDDRSKPTIDCRDTKSNLPIGWRWCRHEIENYLIEPEVVQRATGWPVSDFEEVVRRSALKIRDYEAARWAIGIVRRALPPHFELNTRPNSLKNNEIALPPTLDSTSVYDWASKEIQTHRSGIMKETDSERVEESYRDTVERFDDTFIKCVPDVLVWFSGKDLLAGMADRIVERGFDNPGNFRAQLRDWIRDNPGNALELLPEWKELAETLKR